MRVDLCLSPKAFTMEEVSARLPAVREVLERHNVQLAYLFGSVVRDATGSLSDVDIAVLPDLAGYHWLNTYEDIYDDLCRVFGADNIDIVMLNEAPPPIQFAAVRDGQLIYARDGLTDTDFVEEVIFDYHDTEPLRAEHWYYLRQRVKEGLSKAMRKIDENKVRLLLGRMDEAVLRLRELSVGSEEEFLAESNWQTRALSEHFTRIAIEAAIDVGRHVIVARGLGTPQKYKEVARLLRENAIVPPALGDKLVGMAGMRNVLVHLYWDIDYHKLYKAITAELSSFDEYARCILDYLAKETEIMSQEDD